MHAKEVDKMGATNIDTSMYANERINNKKKRLFSTSFVQNDKKKSPLSIYHPGKNKSPFFFADLADVVSTKTGKI